MTLTNQKEYEQLKIMYPLIEQEVSPKTESPNSNLPMRGRGGAQMAKTTLITYDLFYTYSQSTL
jgi:hypothetical protein